MSVMPDSVPASVLAFSTLVYSLTNLAYCHPGAEGDRNHYFLNNICERIHAFGFYRSVNPSLQNDIASRAHTPYLHWILPPLASG